MIEKYILCLVTYVCVISSADLSNCKVKAARSGLSSFRDSISNIEAGQKKLIPTDQGHNGRYIPFNVTFADSIGHDYDLTTSIQNIYSFIPAASRIDFRITGVKLPTLFTGIFVIDSQAKWGSVVLSYLVTSRNDFAAGNLILNNDRLIFQGSNNSQISFLITVPSKSQLNNYYAFSVPFISGMLTFDESLSLNFTDCQFLQNSSQLNITLVTRYSKYPLESLSVSYIIFNMASELQITSFFNLSFIPTNVNTYLGLSSVDSNSQLFQTHKNGSSSAHFGLKNSPAQFQIFNEMFAIDGVIIQTQQSIDILYLANQNSSTTLFCISKSSCQSYGGNMIYTQSSVFDITSKCSICGRSMVFNNITKQCTCISGFILQNGSCVNKSSICPSNSSFNHATQVCQCNQFFVNVSGECKQIVLLCSINEVYFGGKCIPVHFSSQAHSCPINYLLLNKTCIQQKNCLPPLNLDRLTNSCQCPDKMQLVNEKCISCAENQTFLGKKCVCSSTFFRINGQCLQCNSNAYFDGSKCVCMHLFDGDGFSCKAQSKKKPTSIPGSVAFGSIQNSGINKMQNKN